MRRHQYLDRSRRQRYLRCGANYRATIACKGVASSAAHQYLRYVGAARSRYRPSTFGQDRHAPSQSRPLAGSHRFQPQRPRSRNHPSCAPSVRVANRCDRANTRRSGRRSALCQLDHPKAPCASSDTHRKPANLDPSLLSSARLVE